MNDASTDGAALQDAGADDAGPPTYSTLSDTSNWATFGTTTVNSTNGAQGAVGAAFDGRYVYFVPNRNPSGPKAGQDGAVVRYDTQADFATGSSWSTFDMTTVNPGAKAFAGAAFDGRYVYFAPDTTGLTARYDTQADFATGSSWGTFDVATVSAGAAGFAGAVFDGRYVYLVPNTNSTSIDGVVARYDTQAGFTASGSWSTFDATTVNAAAKGFYGAVFDGRYVYFVPDRAGASLTSGVVTRYDTQAGFTASGSWSTFDATTVNPGAQGFFGAAFDGRYVYFTPFNVGGSPGGVVAQYDTQAAFTAAASWSTFDVTTRNVAAKGFIGAAFDGRYVYLVPYNSGSAGSFLARYDTQAPFATVNSWSTFDMTKVNGSAVGFEGAAFDGRYLYFVPNSTGLAARFDAKTPPGLPPGPAHGSFF